MLLFFSFWLGMMAILMIVYSPVTSSLPSTLLPRWRLRCTWRTRVVALAVLVDFWVLLASSCRCFSLHMYMSGTWDFFSFEFSARVAFWRTINPWNQRKEDNSIPFRANVAVHNVAHYLERITYWPWYWLVHHLFPFTSTACPCQPLNWKINIVIYVSASILH